MSSSSRGALAARLRNLVFGVEDSLVSTVGLLSGIAIANVPRHTIFLTGVVLIFVEAFSMAAGSFLSEASAEEYAKRKQASAARPLADSVIMFVSYFISGFIPLFPYVVMDTQYAFPLSIIASLVALLALGAWGGYVTKLSLFRGALRMFLVGGLAIGVGIAAGAIVG